MTMMGHNGMTRDEWLHAILMSGEVTRIAQHLALVIYHLSDPATNTAKLSARDLEKITGWGKSAIVDHITELNIFMRVRWGQGRAKAIFEMQGVIAAAMTDIRSVRQADTTAATNRSVRQDATTADTTADTKIEHQNAEICGRQTDTTAATTVVNTVQVSATRTQVFVGGGKGGGVTNNPLNPESLSQGVAPEVAGTPKAFMIHQDGSYSGTAFEHLTVTEMANMRAAYAYLEFPAELIAADQFLTAQFDREVGAPEFGSQERFSRLHQYLNAQNRKAAALAKSAMAAVRAKSELSPDESCWFADDRLMVANGFKSELLDLVGGDERRLRLTLDKAAISVPIDLKGAALRKVVRGQFTRNADWQAQDERKTTAYEKKIGPADAPGAPSKFDKMRAAAEKAQAAIDGKTR